MVTADDLDRYVVDRPDEAGATFAAAGG